MLRLRRFRSVQDAGYFGLNEAATNTKTAVFKLKFCTEPVRQGSHQLKAQPSIGGWVEILRKTDAVVGDFDHEGAVVSRLATDMDFHRQARRMRVLSGVGQKLGGDKSGVKCVTRVDVAVAGIFDR